MAADLGGFTDVLLLVGLAAGLVWWYYNKPTPKVEQKTGKKPGEKKEDGIIRKSKFPQNPKRSVRFSGKRTKRSVQKRKARNTQKAETKVL